MNMADMECSRCGQITTFELAGHPVCDGCVTQNSDLYYSVDYLAILEKRLVAARNHYGNRLERGIGGDVRSNPTKGRSQLHHALTNLETVESAVALVRCVLVGRGAIEPTLDEELDKVFPNLKNNEVIEWHGKRYRHRWLHRRTDSSGRNIWSRAWISLRE
jgi:hypothetical protein